MSFKFKLGLAGLFFSSLTFAENEKYRLSAALVGMNMDYREYDDAGTLLDSEKSSFSELSGVDFNFAVIMAHEKENFSEINVNFMILGGNTQYVGSLLDSGEGYGSYIGRTANSVSDFSVDYKYINRVSDNFALNYGVGLGYRSWERALSTTQIEVYAWYSLRPMIGATYSDSKFSLGLIAEYQYGFDTTMALLSNSENAEKSVTLGSANIFELSIPVNYSVSDQVDIFAEYIYQQQIIEKSNVIDYTIDGTVHPILEPASTANNQYLKFGLAFKF